MNTRSSGSIIQGSFQPGALRQLSSPQRPSCLPMTRRTAPPTFRELTIQAHQRSAGLPAPAASAGTVALLQPHQAPFRSRQGQPLPPAVREKMESFFNTDFSGVHVHIGPQAPSIGALAFTQGADLFFAPGHYNPHTPNGQQLLGHELAHVLQQRAGRVRNPFGSGLAVVQDPVLEAEAERMGTLAAAHHATIQSKPAVAVSGPMSIAEGQYKFIAGPATKPMGAVSLHSGAGSAIELTDLAVDAAHRSKGLGHALLASALRTGLRLGKKRVTLASDDDGTGRLTRWYRRMGFRPTGVNERGRPRLEAPIRRALSGVAQGRMLSMEGLPLPNGPGSPVRQCAEVKEPETLSLGGNIVVNVAVFHAFKQAKLKDAGRGGGKGSDLVKCDSEGNIIGTGQNIFQKAAEKGDAFAQRLFTEETYPLYEAWKEENPVATTSAVKPYKNKRDKFICGKCNKPVARTDAQCPKCDVTLDWTGLSNS